MADIIADWLCTYCQIVYFVLAGLISVALVAFVILVLSTRKHGFVQSEIALVDEEKKIQKLKEKIDLLKKEQDEWFEITKESQANTQRIIAEQKHSINKAHIQMKDTHEKNMRDFVPTNYKIYRIFLKYQKNISSDAADLAKQYCDECLHTDLLPRD